MAVNEKFTNFVIRLAVDEDFKAAFEEDPDLIMSAEGLSKADKKALLKDQVPPIRLQIENVQTSGAARGMRRKRRTTQAPIRRKAAGKKR